MWNWISSLFTTTTTTTETPKHGQTVIKIAVIGNTETGKTHFISKVASSEEGFWDTLRPTFGTYRMDLAHKSRKNVTFELTEIGYTALNNFPVDYIETEGIQCIMWFIDCHDSAEDIYPIRSVLLRFMDQFSSKKHRQPPLLCIIHNIGRPHVYRNKCIRSSSSKGNGNYVWVKDENACQRNRSPVKWENLRKVIGTKEMSDKFSGIIMSELSYTEADTPAMVFDWIYRKSV